MGLTTHHKQPQTTRRGTSNVWQGAPRLHCSSHASAHRLESLRS